jgi:hypothetical protein
MSSNILDQVSDHAIMHSSLWSELESESFTNAFRIDFTELCTRFILGRKLDFSEFKSHWKALDMSQIHYLCPNRINPILYLQSMFETG